MEADREQHQDQESTSALSEAADPAVPVADNQSIAVSSVRADESVRRIDDNAQPTPIKASSTSSSSTAKESTSKKAVNSMVGGLLASERSRRPFRSPLSSGSSSIPRTAGPSTRPTPSRLSSLATDAATVSTPTRNSSLSRVSVIGSVITNGPVEATHRDENGGIDTSISSTPIPDAANAKTGNVDIGNLTSSTTPARRPIIKPLRALTAASSSTQAKGINKPFRSPMAPKHPDLILPSTSAADDTPSLSSLQISSTLPALERRLALLKNARRHLAAIAAKSDTADNTQHVRTLSLKWLNAGREAADILFGLSGHLYVGERGFDGKLKMESKTKDGTGNDQQNRGGRRTAAGGWNDSWGWSSGSAAEESAFRETSWRQRLEGLSKEERKETLEAMEQEEREEGTLPDVASLLSSPARARLRLKRKRNSDLSSDEEGAKDTGFNDDRGEGDNDDDAHGHNNKKRHYLEPDHPLQYSRTNSTDSTKSNTGGDDLSNADGQAKAIGSVGTEREEAGSRDSSEAGAENDDGQDENLDMGMALMLISHGIE